MTKEEIRAVAGKRRAAEKYQFRLAFEKAGFPVTAELVAECPETEFQPLSEEAVDYPKLVHQISSDANISPAMATMPAYHIIGVLTAPIRSYAVENHHGWAVVKLGDRIYILASSPSRDALDRTVEEAFGRLCIRGLYDLTKKGGSWTISPRGENGRKYRRHGNWVKREEWPWFVKHFSRKNEKTGVFETHARN